jgi:hypothetical protein
MYRIGEFASLSDVSTKTLRFYDEIGLLRPATTDPITRYCQVRPAVRIASLGTVTSGYDDVALAEAELLDRVATPAHGRSRRPLLRGVLWYQCADAGMPAGEPFVELDARHHADRQLDLRELPSATVACAYAADDFAAAERAYRAILAWMTHRPCELTGPKRELNHGGVLEIQFPIVWHA